MVSNKVCYGYIMKCDFCEKRSMHLSFTDLVFSSWTNASKRILRKAIYELLVVEQTEGKE